MKGAESAASRRRSAPSPAAAENHPGAIGHSSLRFQRSPQGWAALRGKRSELVIYLTERMAVKKKFRERIHTKNLRLLYFCMGETHWLSLVSAFFSDKYRSRWISQVSFHCRIIDSKA